MKKLTAILLSIILIFPAGTVSVLADPVTDAVSAAEQSDADPNDSSESSTDSEKSGETEITSGEITGDSSDAANADDAISEEKEDGSAENPDAEDDSVDAPEEEVQEEDGAEETSGEEAELATLSAQTYSIEDYLNDPIEIGSLSLEYDDRSDLSELSEYISSDESYTLCMGTDVEISSYKVENGIASTEKDESLIALTGESSTKVAATGVGEGDVYIIKTEDLETLKNLGNGDPDGDPDAGEPDENEPDTGSSGDGTSDGTSSGEVTSNGGDSNEGILDEDKIDVYKLSVTVKQAPLTLMFLIGQSNMEGNYSTAGSSEYEPEASIACTEGTVYSTYLPSTAQHGQDVTGISSMKAATASNAGEFVTGSLQGAVESTETSEDSSYIVGGTLADPLNISGAALTYPLNSLTEPGGGKTGPDSGLAWEWNKQTGDKVWVINTAYSGSSITSWISTGSNYARSAAAWEYVLNTYNAEMNNHYTNGSVSGNKLVFWLQGETGDSSLGSAADYESYFSNMYTSVGNALGNSSIPFGIIMVRAGNGGTSYLTEGDLVMTSPRIAQYFLGSSNSSYDNVYVVSNVNEQWVSDSGVKSYFSSSASSGLSYPMQGASKSLPTTVKEVHPNIHYTQVGHNENGITAADGMLAALGNSSGSCSVTWKDENANSITSLTLDFSDEFATAVPVVEPVYLAKKVTYSISPTDVISYDYATGILTGASDQASGTAKITPSGASGTLSVTITYPADSVLDIEKINGTWTYTVNGKPDYTYTGLAKNSNGWYYIKDGVLDRTYTGFATNENGSWYITEGKLTRKDNSVLQDKKGVLGSTSDYYYVIGSKVQYDFTGLADYSNSSGWWYITNGVVDRSVTTVAKNKNGWYYVKNGKVDKSYTGFATNSNGSWYVASGKVTKKVNGVYKDTTGAIGAKNEWYYILNNKVQYDFTGLANYSNASGWWYITNGVVDRSVTTVAKNKNGWYYVKNGKVDKSYTGFATNSNGSWYVKSGKVSKTVNGVYKDSTGAIGAKNEWYYVLKNKVQYDFTGLANYRNSSGWWYITNGKVDRTFTGIATNKNGTYYLKNGKVQQSFSGSVKIDGKTYQIKNGKVV